jgi:hypothetical protein
MLYDKTWFKNYYESNKEKYKNHYEENKAKLNEKITCNCGGKYTYQNKAVHNKTQRHINYTNKSI